MRLGNGFIIWLVSASTQPSIYRSKHCYYAPLGCANKWEKYHRNDTNGIILTSHIVCLLEGE